MKIRVSRIDHHIYGFETIQFFRTSGAGGGHVDGRYCRGSRPVPRILCILLAAFLREVGQGDNRG